MGPFAAHEGCLSRIFFAPDQSQQYAILEGHPFPGTAPDRQVDSFPLRPSLGIQNETTAPFGIDHEECVIGGDQGAAVNQILIGQLALPQDRPIVPVTGNQLTNPRFFPLMMGDVAGR